MTATSRYRLKDLRRLLAPTAIHWFARLGSTNTRAVQMIRAGLLRPPALVLTGWQVAGRGRGTNTWWSSAGSLTMTMVVRARPDRPAHHLPLIAGAVARQTLVDLTGITDIKLKWPNDLLLAGRKLGGILCERVDDCDVVGLGLNANLDVATAPTLLQKRITSLSHVTGHTFDQTELLGTIVAKLTDALTAPADFDKVLSEYAEHHALTGRRITVTDTAQPTLTGTCLGLDNQGRLLLKCGPTTEHLISGHVEVYGTP